jgi:hypothetical protein
MEWGRPATSSDWEILIYRERIIGSCWAPIDAPTGDGCPGHRFCKTAPECLNCGKRLAMASLAQLGLAQLLYMGILPPDILTYCKGLCQLWPLRESSARDFELIDLITVHPLACVMSFSLFSRNRPGRGFPIPLILTPNHRVKASKQHRGKLPTEYHNRDFITTQLR